MPTKESPRDMEQSSVEKGMGMYEEHEADVRGLPRDDLDFLEGFSEKRKKVIRKVDVSQTLDDLCPDSDQALVEAGSHARASILDGLSRQDQYRYDRGCLLPTM